MSFFLWTIKYPAVCSRAWVRILDLWVEFITVSKHLSRGAKLLILLSETTEGGCTLSNSNTALLCSRTRKILERDLTGQNFIHTKLFNISVQRPSSGTRWHACGGWDGNNIHICIINTFQLFKNYIVKFCHHNFYLLFCNFSPPFK